LQAAGLAPGRAAVLHGLGVGLAALAGVLSAPINQVRLLMGADLMIAFVIMGVLLAIVPLTGLYPYFVMQALCFALFACALNLLIGYGGLLSFGHAMFLGTAGYASAHALKVWGVSPEIGIIIGMLAACGLSVVTGLIAIRRQGIYFAMITLALSQLLFFIYLQTPFTHGEDGIQGIPQGKMFGFLDLSQPTTLYYVVLAIFLLAFLLIHRAINSPFGEVLKSIRGAKRLAHRRPLDHVRRGGADDPGRWPRHGVRPRGRRRLPGSSAPAAPG